MTPTGDPPTPVDLGTCPGPDPGNDALTEDRRAEDDRGLDHDLRLIRRMLAIPPEDRLQSLAAAYPLVRVGLVRRLAAGGSRKP